MCDKCVELNGKIEHYQRSPISLHLAGSKNDIDREDEGAKGRPSPRARAVRPPQLAASFISDGAHSLMFTCEHTGQLFNV
jgi:hypothetical protein